MRDYSKVSGQFWIGKTGKALRGNLQAQIVAMYLMTSPHANMIGVYHCPVMYIAHETGSSIEGASKALQTLIEGDFCTYDEATETVWVHEMARFQIGDELSPVDKQVKGIQKQFDNLPEGPIKQGFHKKYKEAFHLREIEFLPVDNSVTASPLEAPSKPLLSQEQEREQEQEQEQNQEQENESRGRDPALASPTHPLGDICQTLKRAGVTSINTQHPTLLALIEAGATASEFKQVAFEAVKKGKGSFAYVLAVVTKRREEAAKLTLHQGALPNKQEALEQSNRAATAGWQPPELRGGVAA